MTLHLVYLLKMRMDKTLHLQSIYPEIVIHATLDLMTKMTEYPNPAKQEAKIEAHRSNIEVQFLQKVCNS